MLIQRSCESARPISIDLTEAIGFLEEDLEISAYEHLEQLFAFLHRALEITYNWHGLQKNRLQTDYHS